MTPRQLFEVFKVCEGGQTTSYSAPSKDNGRPWNPGLAADVLGGAWWAITALRCWKTSPGTPHGGAVDPG
jgi:hypothetical protein